MFILYDKIMLTRAFLILLAMMTGLTAAQAAEAVRPAQNALSVSTSNDAQAYAEVALASKQRHRLYITSFTRLEEYIIQVADTRLREDTYAPMQRTFISDRARL
jgi:hypothetical protein